MPKQDDKEVDIILAEYQGLRDEIVAKMNSSWQILTFETGGTSLILGFVFANQQYVLLPIIPFLILVSSFLHLGETLAIVNAGNYIRTIMRPDLQRILKKSDQDFKPMSWEDYIIINRKAYDWIHITTVTLFVGMFWASIILTIIFKGKIGIPPTNNWFNPLFILLLLGYILVFVVYLYYWTKLIREQVKKYHKLKQEIPS
jgi:hypothetical protein